MDEYISERLLKAACYSAFCAEDLSVELPAEEHQFSRSFQRKMKRAIRQADRAAAGDRPRIRWKAVLVTVLAVLLSVSVTVMAVEPLREGFLRMIRNVFSDHTEISFETASEVSEIEGGFQVFQLGYIPAGFQLTEETDLSEAEFYVALYEGQEGKTFTFTQTTLEQANLNIGSKDHKYEEFTINDMNAYYNEDQINNNLVLYNEQYAITISGNIPKEELVKIAQSAKP